MAIIIPSMFQLFGPQHYGYVGRQGPSWQFPETANSSSIKPLYLHGDSPPQCWWAAWNIIWNPAWLGGSKTRLVAMDTSGPGYGNWETLAEFQGPAGRGPSVMGQDITAYINQWVAQRRSRYIGFQMWDDGSDPYWLWESRLEFYWIVPTAMAAMASLSGGEGQEILRGSSDNDRLVEKRPKQPRLDEMDTSQMARPPDA